CWQEERVCPPGLRPKLAPGRPPRQWPPSRCPTPPKPPPHRAPLLPPARASREDPPAAPAGVQRLLHRPSPQRSVEIHGTGLPIPLPGFLRSGHTLKNGLDADE